MGLWEIIRGEQPDPLTAMIHAVKHGNDTGEMGEYFTEYALNTLPGDYFVLKNVYIPYRGRTSEIDVLLVHTNGIFVFESKNYSGWIFGSRDQKFWTQSLSSKKKIKFYNPILQNQTHINALSLFLNLDKTQKPSSYIAFSERCELKSVPERTKDTVVCNRNQMLKILKADIKENPQVFSMEDLKTIHKLLLPLTHKSQEEKEQHVNDVNEIKNRK